ncbi:hypothetical protein F5050DRAFT_1811916 [Lentinula boryana]|uniref:DUF6699 domain-containing protein n=1 Tax=Lentinula boryana TaxID=40481 RepID=A0ABQ8Q072_9AGAR|nr:hypothetical protein F5050DRAFT_1811916 [Lentinula boryana]
MLIDEYRPHAFFYLRSVNDLSVPWVPSPFTPARQLPPSKVGSPVSLLSSTSTTSSKSPPRRTKKTLQFHLQLQESQASSSSDVGTRASERRKHRHLSFLRSVRKQLKSRKMTPKVLEVEIEQYDPAELEPTASATPPIPLSEWKAWSYYARPCVNGVDVDNLSPKPKLDVELDIQMMFDHIKSPGGTPHPERWIKGQKHPALPPRPATWKRVDPLAPLPFPWEIQLNPLLTHSLITYPEYTPIYWNLTLRTSLLFFLTEDGGLQFVMDNDVCQPASCPLVTHMYICAYAFAPDWNVQYKLPWPIMLQSRDGITCEDFFDGLYENFSQHLKKSEYEKWDEDAQRYAMQSHIKHPRGWAEDDLMKRSDILGDNIFYRGLAPSLNMEGWVLLLGTEPPMMIKENPF